ncbi:uncharacterized protein LOC125377077 [Haliotis rufescens]|uniref:uncharacterized protein LOC125377077 n=1 Tax=Haliotis rufescens TaxID=6454 RepID=UPI00201F38DC|nr:uncharacterized protein LOC125377077 [Haliotis rufescens]
MRSGCTAGSDGTVSESGWSNGVIFQDYLDRHFLRYASPATPNRPLLLLYDGHKSHISPSLIDWAKDHNIVLFVLPAHTSHILQPMDVGCFGPFTKIYNIASVACRAYSAALTPGHLQSAFRKSGIYPFSPDMIDKSAFQPAAFIHASHVEDKSQQVPATDDIHSPRSNPNVEKENLVTNFDQTQFFVDQLPVIQKKQRKPRRSIHKIVSGNAITEPEIEIQVKNYVKSSTSKQPVPTKKRPAKSHTSAAQSQKKHKSTTEPAAGPSGAINLLYSSDSEDSPISDDETCCVCHHFQPAELAQCTSLSFVQWGQCMYHDLTTGCTYSIVVQCACFGRMTRFIALAMVCHANHRKSRTERGHKLTCK